MSDQQTPEPESQYDTNASVPDGHDFGVIIGNELRCVIHKPNTACPVVFVKPTQVLIQDKEGKKHLYDTAEAREIA